MLDVARSFAELTVVDLGFCLEADEELSFDTAAPRRNGATLAVLENADLVVAVGSADGGTVAIGQDVVVVNAGVASATTGRNSIGTPAPTLDPESQVVVTQLAVFLSRLLERIDAWSSGGEVTLDGDSLSTSLGGLTIGLDSCEFLRAWQIKTAAVSLRAMGEDDPGIPAKTIVRGPLREMLAVLAREVRTAGAWPDETAKKAAWAEFMADEEWNEIKRVTSVEHGKLIGAIEDRTLVLTHYSALVIAVSWRFQLDNRRHVQVRRANACRRQL